VAAQHPKGSTRSPTKASDVCFFWPQNQVKVVGHQAITNHTQERFVVCFQHQPNKSSETLFFVKTSLYPLPQSKAW
jgi:hypothetical protein